MCVNHWLFGVKRFHSIVIKLIICQCWSDQLVTRDMKSWMVQTRHSHTKLAWFSFISNPHHFMKQRFLFDQLKFLIDKWQNDSSSHIWRSLAMASFHPFQLLSSHVANSPPARIIVIEEEKLYFNNYHFWKMEENEHYL